MRERIRVIPPEGIDSIMREVYRDLQRQAEADPVLREQIKAEWRRSAGQRGINREIRIYS